MLEMSAAAAQPGAEVNSQAIEAAVNCIFSLLHKCRVTIEKYLSSADCSDLPQLQALRVANIFDVYAKEGMSTKNPDRFRDRLLPSLSSATASGGSAARSTGSRTPPPAQPKRTALQTFAQLQALSEKLRQDLKSTSEELDKKRSGLKAAQDELSVGREDLQAHQDAVDDLREQIDAKQFDIHQDEGRLRLVEAQVATCTQRVEAAQRDMSLKLSDERRLRDVTKQRQRHLKSCEAAFGDAKATFNAIISQSSAAARAIKLMQEVDAPNLTAEYDTLQQTLLNASPQDKSRIQSEQQRVSLARTALQRKVAYEERALTQLRQNDEQRAHRALSESKAALEKAQHAIDDTEVEVDDVSSQLEMLKRNVEQDQKELSEIRAAVQQCQAAVVQKREALTAMQRQLKAAQRAHERKSERYAKKVKALDGLESECSQLEATVTVTKSSLDATDAQLHAPH